METAAAAAKRRGSEPDLLSALSDGLLCHVLSFLPSRQAVQTTVLSERWMDLWRSVATVRISTRDFEGGTSTAGQYCWGRLQNFTDNLLMLNTARRLDVFRLDLGWVTDSPDLHRGTERWVCRGIKCQPLVLQIRVCRIIFRYHFQIPLLGSGFHRLKSLELAGVILDHGFSERLSSGCPALEDLLLHSCDNSFAVIQSDTLRKLVVRVCTSRVADALVVRAPCLASMCLHNCSYINTLSLETGNSHVKASISVTHEQLSPTTEVILLGSLSNVTFLELKFFQAMALLDNEFDKFPMFDNLRTLSLIYCFLGDRDVDTFKALGRFLQKSPNLEELVLQDFWVEGTERDLRKGLTFDQSELETEKPEFPVLENLRTLVVDRCELRDNFRILRILLWSSPNLEKLTVRHCCEVKPVVGPIEFPMLENLRTLVVERCELRDNFRILRHLLRSSPNLEKLTVELPEVSMGWKGKGKMKKTCPRFGNLVRFQCPKLKSTEIIYEKGVKIQRLVSFLLDVSDSATQNNITLTKL